MNLDPKLEKLIKLKALSTSTNYCASLEPAVAHERAAAQSRLDDKQREYGITHKQAQFLIESGKPGLVAPPETDLITARSVLRDSKMNGPVSWTNILLSGLSYFNKCTLAQVTGTFIFGDEMAVQTVLYTFDMLCLEIRRLTREWAMDTIDVKDRCVTPQDVACFSLGVALKVLKRYSSSKKLEYKHKFIRRGQELLSKAASQIKLHVTTHNKSDEFVSYCEGLVYGETLTINDRQTLRLGEGNVPTTK